MAANFTFTRNPSTKTRAKVIASSITAGNNTLVLIGKRAASGGSATTNVPIAIDNGGDPVAAATECTAKFGATSQIGEMVVAAIKGVLFSDVENKSFPPIVCIAVANDDDSTDLAATLAANLTQPMPFVAVPYKITDAPALSALKAHLTAISADDRGDFGQFGSFGFMAADEATSTASTAATSAASPFIMAPWLRDSGGSTANKPHAVAAAVAAVCASLGIPYNPLNDAVVGGLVAPASAADYHTPGDAGTISLGLSAGLIPLKVASDGSIKISRTVTTSCVVTGTPDSSYYDMQDWQPLYLYRQNAYVLASKAPYKQVRATDAILKSLKSDLIDVAKKFEKLGMFQYVDQFANLFTCTRQQQNRYGAVYQIPVNVVPGFHNKGIEVDGTTLFDSFNL